MFNTTTMETMETLALSAREAAGKLARLEAAELVYRECPTDERAEARLRDAVVRAHDARSRFLFQQLEELQREGWNFSLPEEMPGSPQEARSLSNRILDLGEATLHLIAASERQKRMEAELWEAIGRGHKPTINVAALATAQALGCYEEALKLLLAARSHP